LYPKHTAGFTLLELIITVALIGVLACIAYASYSSFLLKTHRADALTALLQEQMTLERCYAEHTSYSKDCDFLPEFPKTTPQGHYTIDLTQLSTHEYLLLATPLGSQKYDRECGSFSIDQTNLKSAVDTAGAIKIDCWR
jgi:type IV pilus assembly protein PilE